MEIPKKLITKFIKFHKIPLLLLLSAVAFYFSFAWDLDRSDFVKLISLYAGLFFVSFKLIQLEKYNFRFLLIAAVFLRLIFLFALPNLSQDFYRFIWDGRLITEGFNPYLSLPKNFQYPIALASELINGMGSLSAGNYTNYPPVNQLIFSISAILGGKTILGPVIAMRLFIIAADLGTLWFGKKLLESFNLPAHRIFWYILNPFIIIEVTGNLHFEGVMIFFLVWSLYLLHRKKWIGSAILLGVSVSAKLIPLIILPLFLKYFRSPSLDRLRMADLGKQNSTEPKPDLNDSGPTTKKELGSINFKKLIFYYLLVGLTVIISFLPFLSAELFSNFSQSIGLWFQKFEFNASIYYIVREIGFYTHGYNIIATAGKILPIFTILILLGLAIFRRNFSTEKLVASMLLGISTYFFLSTTIHPWYIATPLILSIFTRYRFALIWSFVVFFSYYAYSIPGFEENLWMVSLEYMFVLLVFGIEIFSTNLQRDETRAFDFRAIYRSLM